MRVAYLMRYLPAPSETFVLDEALAVQRAGAEVLPFVLDRVASAVRHARHEPLYKETRVVPRPSSPRAIASTIAMEERPAFAAVRAAWSTAGRRRDLRRVAWLARKWKALDIDVVRCHFASETARFAVAAGTMAGIPVSVAVHARDLFVPVEDFSWIVRSSDLVTTITPFHRDRLLRLGLPSERVELLECPVTVPPERAAAPAPGSSLRVLSVGRMVAKKGHDLLMKACASLAVEGTPIELTIVGDGPERFALRSLAGALGQHGGNLTIEMLGALPIEDVEALIVEGQFHACVLACRVAEDGDRDGVPVSLLEARARGLPIITSDLPGFDFDFTPEGGGVLVATATRGGRTEPLHANLIRALAELYRDPGHQRGLADQAREAAESRVSPEQIGERLYAMLNRVRSTLPSAPETPS
ncbi:MAG: glycosyltransferase family 4 protein [Proteobacteria bacterium]|nr:glycosyltransferase family 4 protein [Pseudomonadota bacterium]